MYRMTLGRLFSLLLLLLAWMPGAPAQTSSSLLGLEQQLKEYLSTRQAQVGVALIVDGKDTLSLNNDVRYPLMSVFKFHQALAVAHYLQCRHLPLSTTLFISPEALRPDTYSPLRDRYPEGNISLSIAELLTYTLQLSDNNACDILFDRTAGVAETDAYIRSLGLRECSIRATEADMHRDPQLCRLNNTSPLDAARLLELFLTRALPGEPYHSFIKETLLSCRTGLDRMAKPLLPAGVQVGHKTGTGDRDERGRLMAINDIGFVLLPDGRRYTLAVFVADSEEGAEESAAIIAGVSERVYRWLVP